MKKIKYIITSFLMIFAFSFVSAKNDIKSIEMDIYVDNDGDAHVTEKWTARLDQGTEGYKPYYNLGNSEIKDFSVSMDGILFDTKSNWNVNGSLADKKYSAGLHEISDGIELCFGISKYGTNTYVMKYTITNFVSTTDDADMIYWTLIPHELSDKPELAYIKIYSDFDYDKNWDVWGYGNKGGTAYIYDGYIEMQSDGALKSDQYMTILVKFPKGTFNTDNTLNDDFDHYYDMAQKGASKYRKNIIKKFFAILLGILFYVFIFVFVIIGVSNSQVKYGTKKVITKKKLPKKDKDIPYFRDLPCDKDIFQAYWYACQYGLVKNQTDFLGSVLLKWMKNGNVENITTVSKILKKETSSIKFNNSNGMSDREIQIYDMMVEASLDGILEKDEFTKWCKKHYSKILNWFNKVIDDYTDVLVNNGNITVEKKWYGKKYIVNDSLYENAERLLGLKKFLNEFSSIKDKQAIEVALWEEYLMYAQIFGIAKKVAKEFKDLYPNVITEEVYQNVVFVHNISYEGVHAASVARSRAQSYSSGGGGFSSGGGGGGSFGGGGGGGGFR